MKPLKEHINDTTELLRMRIMAAEHIPGAVVTPVTLLNLNEWLMFNDTIHMIKWEATPDPGVREYMTIIRGIERETDSIQFESRQALLNEESH